MDLSDVRSASARLHGVAHVTPVTTCRALDDRAGRKLYLKCEHLQKVGAFKFRGAYNAVSLLDDEFARQGVVTHSSGNHAQALALAARMRGIPAYLVIPRTANPIKQSAVKGYGGEITLCEPLLDDRDSTCKRVQSETGATFIPPFNHPHIIAGQGTAALELLAEVSDLDAIVAPVGGGGLLSGICIAAKGLNPSVRIFGAEPKGADDAARSLAAGEFVPQTGPNTIADGLLTSLGDLTWPIIRDHVEEIVTVSDEAIVRAMRLVWERAKQLIEPSSAVAVAAVLSEEFQRHGGLGKVGVVISGGNVDLDALPWG